MLSAAAVAATGSIALVGGATAQPTTPTAVTGTTAAPDAKWNTYTPPAIAWGDCENARLQAAGAQCGFVTVPLDYNKPTGKKIKIAVSMIKADPSVRYQGAMLVNPGGPGGSGLTLSRLGAWVPKDAGAGYDWIGFDPRGVGSSEPAMTCDETITAPVREYYAPTTATRLRYWTSKTKGYASSCAEKNAALLPYMRSASTVMDMESIRKALGRNQLNFYGFSYGTYLGQAYATKYPARTRRFVLDGVVDSKKAWYDANLDQNVAFEKSMREWFNWIAENDDAYGLGTDGQDVRRKWYEIRAQLASSPQPGLGPSEWTDVFLSAGYYVYDWDGLAHLFADAAGGDYTSTAAAYADANPQEPGADNGYAVYLGVQCVDAPWPTSWSTWSADGWFSHRAAPFESWGNMWFNAPCRTWGSAPGPQLTLGGSDTPAMLLIGETKDAATPFSGALATRNRFPKSVLIEGVGGTTHSGSLSGVECTDNRIADYLLTGKLPARRSGTSISDVQCDPVPAPDATPVGTGAARTSSSVKNRELREIINEARAL